MPMTGSPSLQAYPPNIFAVVRACLQFYWGTSAWNATQIQEAHAVADRLGLVGPACEQPQYSTSIAASLTLRARPSMPPSQPFHTF